MATHSILYDRVRETATTTGTGTFTLAGAVSGYQTFAAVGNGNLCYYTIANRDAAEWESGIGTYTSSGTTLARTAITASSNSGSAVSFSAGTKDVFLSAPADLLNSIDRGNPLPGRLTLSSSATVADVSAGTTLYYLCDRGSRIDLWDGYRDRPYSIGGGSMSLATSGNFSAGTMYDIFCYVSSGTPTLERLAWTNTTTRATAVTLQSGRWRKSGDATRMYLGSVYCTTTNQLDDDMTASLPVMGIWNVDNRALRTGYVQDTTNSWAYTTGSYRSWNNSASNRVNVVQGLAMEDTIATMYGLSNAAAYPTGVGVDSTSANSAQERWPGSYGSAWSHLHIYQGRPGVGLRYFQALEYGGAGGTFYGDNNTPEYCRCGLTVKAWG